MITTVSSRTELLEQLIQVLERTTEGRITVPRDVPHPPSLRDLGLDSLATLTFLVAVEDEFGIEWSDDLPEETLSSLDLMAEHIAKELGVDA